MGKSLMQRFFFWFTVSVCLAFSIFYTKQWIRAAWFSPRHLATDRGIQLDSASARHATIVTDLQIPWDIAFLNDGEMLVTERPGRLIRINKNQRTILFNQPLTYGEGGLHGIALHPNFSSNHWIYLYRTIKKGRHTINRVERYRLENDKLTDGTIIIDDIPGAMYHDGGRIAFGPDGYLYIATGDASQPDLAQDLHSLAGKILRLSADGSIPADNPFSNATYSYGHRNPQGLTWDDSQRLWSTEHGPSGIDRGEDELNLIEKGQNYGWPIITGNQTKPNMKTPMLQSGKEETWAPASALYWDGSIFFGGLRGSALYEAQINKNPIELKEHFKGQFGRIRTVVLGPDGYFYLTTSNRDGRGFPRQGDDKIIKINPRIFRGE
jgi:glucose/arabinose dehydrogenase